MDTHFLMQQRASEIKKLALQLKEAATVTNSQNGSQQMPNRQLDYRQVALTLEKITNFGKETEANKSRNSVEGLTASLQPNKFNSRNISNQSNQFLTNTLFNANQSKRTTNNNSFNSNSNATQSYFNDTLSNHQSTAGSLPSYASQPQNPSTPSTGYPNDSVPQLVPRISFNSNAAGSSILSNILTSDQKHPNDSQMQSSPLVENKQYTQNYNGNLSNPNLATPFLLISKLRDTQMAKQTEVSKSTLMESELTTIRQENQILLQKVSQLETELDNLRKVEAQQPSFQNSLPFFRLSEQLSVFVTKLTISESQYDKVDYSTWNSKLTLDTLEVVRPDRPQTLKTFALENITEVYYYKANRRMMLYFRELNQQGVSLFIDFIDENQQRRWDLGLFVNYKIVQCLKKHHLFTQATYKPVGNLELPLGREESTLSAASPQELMVLMTKMKKQYSALRGRLGATLTAKMNFGEQRSPTGLNNLSGELSDDDRPVSPRQLADRSIKGADKKQNSSLTEETPPALSSLLSSLPENTANIDNLSPIEQTPQSPTLTSPKFAINGNQSFEANSRQNTASFLVPSTQFGPSPNGQESDKGLNLLSLPSIPSLISSPPSAFLLALHQGIILTKYSKDGYSPHEKRVTISPDEERLCWADSVSGKDIKSIQIRDIVEVRLGLQLVITIHSYLQLL